MDEEAIARVVPRLVRVGIVMNVDREKRLVRVKFQNEELPSGWLYVIQHYDADVHIEPDGEHRHKIGSAGSHSHPGSSVDIALDGDHRHAIQTAGDHSHPGSTADGKPAAIPPDGDHTHSEDAAGGHSHPSSAVTIATDGEHTHTTTGTYFGDCPKEKHSHERSYATWWMPKIDDAVLCLFLPTDDGDGYVLGGI